MLNQTVENAESFGEIVPIELEAGEASIHSDLLLHGSDSNSSDRRRCGLTLRYCTPDVRAENDRSEEHTSELQSRVNRVCRLLLEKKKLVT